jgi:hypothetical protein
MTYIINGAGGKEKFDQPERGIYRLNLITHDETASQILTF